MMNTVGELVINRTKMLGRVAELEKLIDTLSFSEERLQNKVNEFQEKYESNRLRTLQPGTPWAASQTQKIADERGGGRGVVSGRVQRIGDWTATTISTYCRGR